VPAGAVAQGPRIGIFGTGGEAVARLVRDIGATPVLGGGLDRAALLEATAAFAIGLWFAGADAQAILAPVD
jgi:predicted dinucleotide-binding enzyme